MQLWIALGLEISKTVRDSILIAHEKIANSIKFNKLKAAAYQSVLLWKARGGKGCIGERKELSRSMAANKHSIQNLVTCMYYISQRA